MSKVEAAMMPRTCAQVARKYAKGGSLQAGARTRSILRTAATRGRDARTVVEKAAACLAGAKSSACASRRNLSACSQATSTVSDVQRVLRIDLRGKKAFVAGVADDKGFGWAISKALAEAGCEIILGTWVPALKIFETSYRRGKFAESATLSDGSQMQFKHVYPMDAVFDKLGDVPEEVRTNKRYAAADGDFSVEGVAKRVAEDVGNIDIIVHSLANGPEVQKPLLETSRHGYLAAVSMVQHFGPIMNKGGAAVSLTYLASEKVIPGYGGGMSSAKAALESDTKVLAYEAGRKFGMRVNTISAGPLGSRVAKAIGFIDDMINYSMTNAPLSEKPLSAMEIGQTAAF